MPIHSESTRDLTVLFTGREDIQGFLNILWKSMEDAGKTGFKSEQVVKNGEMAEDILTSVIQNPDIKDIARDMGMLRES